MDHRTKPYRNVAASQQRRVIKRELELPSGAPDAVITLEGWDKATSIRLSLPCLVRCTSSSDMHKEIVELSVSTFLLGQSRYVQCSSVSWPCCEKSDLAADVDARVKEFYSAHFPPGAWIDCGHIRYRPETRPARDNTCHDFTIQLTTPISSSQTSMAEVDDDEADRLTVVKLVQRALAGSRQLAERGSGRLDETTVARYLVQNCRHPVQGDFQSILEQAKLHLKNCQHMICGPMDTTKGRLQWRMQFILCCIDILFRVRIGGSDDRQRRMADAALMVNSIVDQLVPQTGAYSLTVYSVLEAAGWSCHVLGRLNKKRQERVITMAVQQFSSLRLQIPRDNTWFHPAFILMMLTGESYSHICEAIGLKHLGGPGLELSMEADVPWALSLQRLFEVKPAAHKAVQPVGEGGFIIHPQEPTLGQDSEDLQCAPAFADLAHRRAVKPLIPSKRARDHACEPEHDLENIQTTKLGWKPVGPDLLSGELVIAIPGEVHELRNGWNFALPSAAVAGSQVFISRDSHMLVLRDHWLYTVGIY